jgi:hypothetical protein
MSIKLPNNFWAVWLIFLFHPAKTSAPKNQTDPDPRPLHALSFLLRLSSYFNYIDLMALLKLERSPFQKFNQPS